MKEELEERIKKIEGRLDNLEKGRISICKMFDEIKGSIDLALKK